MIGTVVDGKYEVLSKIKEGGMGAILLARHRLLGETRVLKKMKAHLEESASSRERFLREARMATSLHHPNIVTVHDFFEDAADHSFYLVMEHIAGSSLGELIEERRTLAVPMALDIAIQTADALAYLHKRGIIHRDVSPENIMLTQDAEGRIVVKLIDLGVAKQADLEKLTQTGIFVGKIRYGSPEQLGQLKKGEVLDGRSDVYALGCVLYLALTGRNAIEGGTLQDFLHQHLVRGATPIEEADPEGRVPAALRRALMKSISRRREDRFATADDFARVLRDCLADYISSTGADDALGAATALNTNETIAFVQAVSRGVNAGRAAVPTAPAPMDGTPAASTMAETEQIDSEETRALPPQATRGTSGMQPAVRAPGVGSPLPAPRPSTSGATGRSAAVSGPMRDSSRPDGMRPAAVSGRQTAVTDTRPKTAPRPTRPDQPAARRSSGRKGIVVTVTIVLLAAAGAAVYATRKGGVGAAPTKGALVVTASPWADIVSVVDEATSQQVPVPGAVTPTRIPLPAGRYRVTLRSDVVRGPEGNELTVQAEIRDGADTPLHVDMPGFDLDRVVKSYVP